MESLKGQLLIANGSLFDPNFRQTVVFLMEHSDEGAIGVVLNKPGRLTVVEAAPAFASLTGPTDPLYVGGPVQPDAAIVLVETTEPPPGGAVVIDSVCLLSEEPDLLAQETIDRTRVFAGYSGWGPGQLEGELAESSWILERAQADDVFVADPDALWRDLLKRKGGSFAMLATMPYDPSKN